MSALIGLLAMGAFVETHQPERSGAPQEPAEPASVVEKFLAKSEGRLLSYRSLRRLEAAARGGKMHASLTAWTSFDPERGFEYEIVEESGSGMIRSKVLKAALEAERRAKRRDEAARGALTRDNYEFVLDGPTEEGLVAIAIRPRRRDTMLIDGKILLSADDAELVRVEGVLVKRPSFWTRKVQVVRRYAQIGGVHVPVGMDSTADVLLAGRSTFSMNYEYASINGSPVDPAVAAHPRRDGPAPHGRVSHQPPK